MCAFQSHDFALVVSMSVLENVSRLQRKHIESKMLDLCVSLIIHAMSSVHGCTCVDLQLTTPPFHLLKKFSIGLKVGVTRCDRRLLGLTKEADTARREKELQWTLSAGVRDVFPAERASITTC